MAFIGEYGDPDAVNEVLASIPLEPFRLALRGYGCFGNLYWAGLEDNDKLSAYVKRLRRALAEKEIPFDFWGESLVGYFMIMRIPIKDMLNWMFTANRVGNNFLTHILTQNRK